MKYKMQYKNPWMSLVEPDPVMKLELLQWNGATPAPGRREITYAEGITLTK